MTGSSWWIRGYAVMIVAADGQRDLSWDGGTIHGSLEAGAFEVEEAREQGFDAELVALVYLPPGIPEGTSIDVGVSVRLPVAPQMITVELATAPPSSAETPPGR